MMIDIPPAMPLFDSPDYLEEGNAVVNQYIANLTLHQVSDAAAVYEYAADWLLEHRFSENNYKTYRSELTTFLHWVWRVEQCSVTEITRRTLARYIDYCNHPPNELIAYRNVAQFYLDKDEQLRLPNPLWRPFLGKRQEGVELPYKISDKALKTKLAVLSAFYNYLINEEYTERNPAMMLMKNSRFRSRKGLGRGDDDQLQAFTELQWSYVMGSAEQLAAQDPQQHQRTLFLISLMYGCYLRISEVAARPGFTPVMSQFRRDKKTGVWGYYVPLSKGGSSRTVAVSSQLIKALKRYRRFLGLSDLPAPAEETPLFVRHRPSSRGRDAGLLNANLGIRQLRDEIDNLFKQAANQLERDGLAQDAQEVRQMTPHSIRHTGISHDINLNQRPLSHVQADAGHDSIDTTSLYLHTSQAERQQSAQNKPLDHLAEIR